MDAAICISSRLVVIGSCHCSIRRERATYSSRPWGKFVNATNSHYKLLHNLAKSLILLG
jgi:hypothetical protein